MTLLAVVPVRDGQLPSGGAEAVAECGGRCLLVGSATAMAAAELGASATEVALVEVGGWAPGAWAEVLAPLLHDEPVVVLPASADGRDLAPRLAHALHRPLLAGALVVGRHGALLARWGGLVEEEAVCEEAFVATLQPGIRGVEPTDGVPPVPRVVPVAVPEPAVATGTVPDAIVLEVLPPDVATMDLAEAPRIVGGGAGLDGPERLAQLGAVATALGASLGATRVVTDRGWLSHDRQIGTTGVVVRPSCYLAFGVSGAVQHTSGLGQPAHIVSVNLDATCPMMQLADLAIVADANAVVDELAARLLAGGPPG